MRIYNLDPTLTPEQAAVTFAMTSRSPKDFDVVAEEVSETRAADFHEKWVVGYGHSSVAEHAVLRLAIEGISRLACDAVEENRLASYTEKSSRYQVIDKGDYHTPTELGHNVCLEADYVSVMETLFMAYNGCTSTLLAELTGEIHPNPSERLQIRRQVIDQTRALLPAATLTNVGMTANARTLAHAVSKLLSDPLEECNIVGMRMKQEGLEQVPTLLKYAVATPALISSRSRGSYRMTIPPVVGDQRHSTAILERLDRDERAILATIALALGATEDDIPSSFFPGNVEQATREYIAGVLSTRRSEYDPLPRAFELVNYLFSVTLDYGAMREFRRHRMLTPISQRLTVVHGYEVPELFERYGLADRFHEAMEASSGLYHKLLDALGPTVAQYAVTHAHQQQMLVGVNLRELAELVRLRTSSRAHASIRKPVQAMADEVWKAHPELMRLVEVKEDG